MRLNKLEFTNFRCFRSEAIHFSKYTSFVGPNNCGKSTVLRALNLFFTETNRQALIQETDFSVGTEGPLSILYEFDEVDGAAAEALAHYVRDGKLLFELRAERTGNGIVTQCRGLRYGLRRLAPFFAADKAAQRRPLYEGLIADGADLPRWQNMEQAELAMRNYEAQFAEQHERLPSEETAYGATGPLPRLRRFLDWIYVPAVKDASAEAAELRNSAFSKLILFAIRNKRDFSEEIESIRSAAQAAIAATLNGAQDILDEVGLSIDKEFQSLSTSKVRVALQWEEVDTIAVKEPGIRSIFRDGGFLGSPDMFGNGLQRTYIMALLSIAAKTQAENDTFRLMLGIEEPELYQHPPQAKFLANALSDLSEGNAQVLVTTHSPYFVTGRNFESIRVIRRTTNVSNVSSWSVDEQRAYCAERKGQPAIGAPAALSGLDRTLQSNAAEMFFASKVVFVEGQEDEAILVSYLKERGEYANFLTAGCHIVPVGGKSKMPMLLALTRGFGIRAFCVFDFDSDKNGAQPANVELRRYAQDVEIAIPDKLGADFESPLFFSWKDNIQRSITEGFPGWPAILKTIAEEWQWDLERMAKDPMLLAEGVHRACKVQPALPALEQLLGSLRSFWS